MKESVDSHDTIGWSPSVYYAESFVNCTLEDAWTILLDYQAWNPTFVGATVVPVSGKPSTEGEIVLIKKSLTDIKGKPLPEFYAETVKVVFHRHIVWFVYKQDGEGFRNFVDFGLSEAPYGVNFRIFYYDQSQFTGELLLKNRQASQAILDNTAAAFKHYCETHAC